MIEAPDNLTEGTLVQLFFYFEPVTEVVSFYYFIETALLVVTVLRARTDERLNFPYFFGLLCTDVVDLLVLHDFVLFKRS